METNQLNVYVSIANNSGYFSLEYPSIVLSKLKRRDYVTTYFNILHSAYNDFGASASLIFASHADPPDVHNIVIMATL